MRKNLFGIMTVIIAAFFISACSDGVKQDEGEVSGGDVSIEESGNENSENESGADDGMVNEEIDEDTELFEAGSFIDYLHVHYNGHDYLQYGNPWWDRDEEWLNENYVYIAYAEYCTDYDLSKDLETYTTIPPGGCKIYRCNDEDTFILGFWEDDEAIILLARTDLSTEEKESASAATDWKR